MRASGERSSLFEFAMACSIVPTPWSADPIDRCASAIASSEPDAFALPGDENTTAADVRTKSLANHSRRVAALTSLAPCAYRESRREVSARVRRAGGSSSRGGVSHAPARDARRGLLVETE